MTVPAPLEGVTVKPLSWTIARGDWYAETVVGQYAAGPVLTRYSVVLRHYLDGEEVDTVIGRYAGVPEAKAAAQADYEARILSALEIDHA